MSGLLDTSVIMRYLTGEPEHLLPVAQSIIEDETALEVTLATIGECGFVLTKVYGLSRESAVDALIELLSRRNVSVVHYDTALVQTALLLCRPSARVSFTDALIWAEATQREHRVVYTFDERFPRDGVELRHALPPDDSASITNP